LLGIGVEVETRNEQLVVLSPIEGSPAERAGIRSGDLIVSVDGQPIRHDTAADVSSDLHAATARADGRPMTVVYTSGGSTVYGVLMVSNTGQNQSGWWWYYNITPTQIQQYITQSYGSLTTGIAL